ncbi:hypothetical protein C6A87_006980 [Mycobacterium sp. ITM-2016-00317]|uniref:hypothetical protein n=1 Tax=Mycobacterium sp. ITM-2016-00317 TaxID=2099694 RepID=UPI000D49182E|nr:hypothetical protein [Mycobacterium sp. ITM-2016-00317]WNG88943.1 hypothetical protein C6A87_006980 [Mycobacterium sp. ITM-2016-00317]
MNRAFVAAAMSVCAAGAGAVVTAGPAAAHADDALIQYKEPNAAWVMPDVKDEMLFRAEQDVEGVVENKALTFKTVAPNHEAVYNLEDWVVCGESPAAGTPLSKDKTTSVTLLVERPGGEACGA